MHLYEWAPRVFSELPPPVSKPFTSELWTERMQPGISTFAHDFEGVGTALTPLIDFAKTQLVHLQDKWHTFPIFLKATAGMRELPLYQREGIIRAIRIFLASNETCPFSFSGPQQVTRADVAGTPLGPVFTLLFPFALSSSEGACDCW